MVGLWVLVMMYGKVPPAPGRRISKADSINLFRHSKIICREFSYVKTELNYGNGVYLASSDFTLGSMADTQRS